MNFLYNIKIDGQARGLTFEVNFLVLKYHYSISTLHKCVKPGVKLNKFKQNISALPVNSSYHILICRNEPEWIAPPYLLPPFNDKLWNNLWNNFHAYCSLVRISTLSGASSLEWDLTLYLWFCLEHRYLSLIVQLDK